MKKILRNKTIAAMKELPQSVKAEADSQLTQDPSHLSVYGS